MSSGISQTLICGTTTEQNHVSELYNKSKENEPSKNETKGENLRRKKKKSNDIKKDEIEDKTASLLFVTP